MSSALDRTIVPAPAPVRPFSLPAVDHRTLGNGLALFTAVQPHLPLITVRLLIDAGAATEPNRAGGLATLTANALEAGTTRRDAEELSWALESAGAELHVSVGWDGAALSLTFARAHADIALRTLSEIVRDSAFPADELQRMRNEQLGEILQRRSEPRSLANDMTGRFLYAAQSPYARPLIGSRDSVQNLDADSARAFWKVRYAPTGSALILTGDLDAGTIALAEDVFGEWNVPAPPQFPIDASPFATGPRIHIVNRPGSVQSELRFGHVGLPRNTPDFFPTIVMNTILGGAFTSRLNLCLREKHGFTYGVRSAFNFRRSPGPFTIQTAVATDVTVRAVEETLREVAAMREHGPTADELRSAIDYVSGIMPLEWQTTDQVATRLSELSLFNLPDDYYDTYRDHINNVTMHEVQRVAREHVRPDHMAIVVVGDAEQIEPPLRKLGFGPVEVMSLDE